MRKLVTHVTLLLFSFSIIKENKVSSKVLMYANVAVDYEIQEAMNFGTTKDVLEKRLKMVNGPHVVSTSLRRYTYDRDRRVLYFVAQLTHGRFEPAQPKYMIDFILKFEIASYNKIYNVVSISREELKLSSYKESVGEYHILYVSNWYFEDKVQSNKGALTQSSAGQVSTQIQPLLDMFNHVEVKASNKERTFDGKSVFAMLVDLQNPMKPDNLQGFWLAEPWVLYAKMLNDNLDKGNTDCKRNFEIEYLHVSGKPLADPNLIVYHVQLKLDSELVSKAGSPCGYVTRQLNLEENVWPNCREVDTGITPPSDKYAFIELQMQSTEMIPYYHGSLKYQLGFQYMLSDLFKTDVVAWQIVPIPCEYYLGHIDQQQQQILELSVIYKNWTTVGVDICKDVAQQFHFKEKSIACKPQAIPGQTDLYEVALELQVSTLFGIESPNWLTPLLLKSRLDNPAAKWSFLIRLPLKDKDGKKGCYA